MRFKWNCNPEIYDFCKKKRIIAIFYGKILNCFLYVFLHIFIIRDNLKSCELSPNQFNVGTTTANEFVLNSDGFVGNNWVTNGNGVRASFLLRLAKANVLKLLVKADNEKK